MVSLNGRPGGATAALRAAVLAMAMPCISSTASANGRTIVGTWAPDPRECTPVAGMIAIGPLSMQGDDFRCDFEDVARLDDVVTWHGTCGFPENARRATVVARLRGETLTVVIDGGADGPYRRCKQD